MIWAEFGIQLRFPVGLWASRSGKKYQEPLGSYEAKIKANNDLIVDGY